MTAAPVQAESAAPPAGGIAALIRLARPQQWSKGAFVLIGPVYGGVIGQPAVWPAVLGTLAAFSLASSACYVINDIRDREADRAHPRKRLRPIASGAVSLGTARAFAGALGVLALVALAGVYAAVVARPEHDAGRAMLLVGGAVGLYALNTVLYSLLLKRLVIVDVMSLSLGFVLRVLGGCAAAMVEPSSWLLNVTLFVAMFLAFGKRLGERRTMGGDATAARAVQAGYTDELLRMLVVVTAVCCLVTYAGYVQAQAARYTWGFNLLWLTTLPALYALLRAIVQMERGRFDDPTELAARDRPFQAAAGLFVLITAGLMAAFPMERHADPGGGPPAVKAPAAR